MTTGVLEDAGFDFDAELDQPDAVKASGGAQAGGRGTRSGTTRRRRPAKNKLDALQKKLSQEMFTAGTMIGMGLPVTGYYTCQESDTFTKAVVALAEKRPEWVEALEHIADIGPGLAIGRTAVGLGAALAVDRGRADPEKPVMLFLGVRDAWEAVQGDGEEAEGSAYTPPPAPFQPL